METIHRLYDLEYKVKTEEIARLLGYGRSDMPDRVREILTEVEARAPELLEPRCAYRPMRRHDLSHSPYLYHVDAVVLCLVTIGPKLEEAVEVYKREGQLGRALVLDTYGSAAVESAADSANVAIEEELTAKGLHCSPRYSPGYACWDVKEQAWILPTLDGEEIGVKLTEGCMMVPRKSISFAVTCADSPVESRHEHDCDICGMIDCLYQRSE
jgi:hypothetical protein